MDAVPTNTHISDLKVYNYVVSSVYTSAKTCYAYTSQNAAVVHHVDDFQQRTDMVRDYTATCLMNMHGCTYSELG